jgi:tellurite resistance protein
MAETQWRVADAPSAKLAQAVLAVVQSDADRIAWIRAGAVATVAELVEGADAARRFQTMLELAYLVASADGFVETERASLAALLERITGAAVDHATLELHFRDLDDAVTALGRHERLARAAAELEGDAEAEEAIGLVALVALADGHISTPEFGALAELGRHVGLTIDRVRGLVESAVARVGAQLR